MAFQAVVAYLLHPRDQAASLALNIAVGVCANLYYTFTTACMVYKMYLIRNIKVRVLAPMFSFIQEKSQNNARKNPLDDEKGTFRTCWV
jgi:hypothetical protein